MPHKSWCSRSLDLAPQIEVQAGRPFVWALSLFCTISKVLNAMLHQLKIRNIDRWAAHPASVYQKILSPLLWQSGIYPWSKHTIGPLNFHPISTQRHPNLAILQQHTVDLTPTELLYWNTSLDNPTLHTQLIYEVIQPVYCSKKVLPLGFQLINTNR